MRNGPTLERHSGGLSHPFQTQKEDDAHPCRICAVLNASVSQFYASLGTAEGRNKRGRRSLLDWEMESKLIEHVPNSSRVGMFRAQADQRSTIRRRERRMGRCSPIDEVRDDAVCDHHARVRIAPGQHNAVQPLPAPRADLAKV